MKKVLFEVLVWAAVIICFIVLLKINSNLRQQRDRLKSNQSSLLSSINSYKLDSAHTALSIKQLRLTKEELEQSNSSLIKDIDKLNIKLGRVNSAQSVSVESRYEIRTEVRDSIVYLDSVIYKYQCIDYRTPYFVLDGCITSPTSFEGHVQTFDSIVRVEHRVPKKFLFIKYGTKFVREEYFSKNPHTLIKDVKTIVIVDDKNNRKDK